MKIYLVGLPGSGKSTLGKKMATCTGYKLIDSDLEIEKLCKKSIKQIFDQDGETHFRSIEKEFFFQISSNSENYIVATGGGSPCYNNLMDLFLKTGYVIWLHTSPARILNRVTNKNGERPLLSNNLSEIELNKLLNNRILYYSKSNFTLSNFELNLTCEHLNQLLPFLQSFIKPSSP